MKFCSYCCIVIVVLVFVFAVNAFNLENRDPIIKRGEDGTYFGYSVAQHMMFKNGNHTTNWLLIGAPLGRNLQPNTNRSGALFKCPVSMFPSDCIQVPTDGRRSEISEELFPPLSDESKENQWMGVTVRSQGPEGMVLVCAHRYILVNRESRFGQGLCYTLTNELEYENAYEPCKGRPTNLEHQQFGYCQAGTSGALLSDGTAIIGAPGPYTWRGTVFINQVAGDFLIRDKTMYMGPLSDPEPIPVDKYSYLGMSVTGGNFLGKETLFASGAPRSNGTGQVLIFAKKMPSSTLDVKLRINGEQFASSFGYEMASADINGDRISDLIVGAPFYFSRNEGGAAYVYTDLKNCRQNCQPSLKLTGKLESRFGFAISSIGDTNKDGFDDLAIGAPYEGDGAIYIYLGSRNGLIPEPSQILRPLQTGIKTLGYSLNGGLDMDNDGYPDLLVGAYESDAAVMYFGRSIIDIDTEITGSGLKNIDPSKHRCPSDPNSNTTCFTFKACCTLRPQIKNLKITDQNLLYRIEAETFTGERKFSRVYFKTNSDQRQNIINRKIPLIGSKHNYCQEETVYLKENTRDILSPIKFRLNYTLGDDKPRKAILNKQESEKLFMATFQKDCGLNDICESMLVLDAKLLLQEAAKDEYVLMLGDEAEVKLEISVMNYKEPAYETQLFINHPSSLSYIATAKSSHIICTYRNETIVVCSLGNPFKKDTQAHALLRFEPKHLGKSEGKLKFHIHVNSTSKELSEKTTAALTAFVVKRAEVGITGSATSNVLYGGEIKGESAMKYFDDVGSRVIHKYQVANNGPWKIEYLEVHVDWPFQVANNKPQGKWLLYLEERPIIEGGEMCKMSADMVNPLNLQIRPGTQDMINDNEVFQANADPPHNMTVRRKRDTEMVIRPEQHIDRDGHKREVINMNCQNGTAKCIKFYCIIKNLEKNNEATIKIKARLWNSTLVEDYPRIDWVRIVSRARIYIPPEYSIEQNTSNDEAIGETLAYPDLLEQEAEPAPLWIIIVAVVAGLLLLILLTLILWKLGFFKRQRLDPTLSGNLEKHSREDSPFLGS